MAQLPKGGLVWGHDKPIHGSCAIYFPGGIRVFSFYTTDMPQFQSSRGQRVYQVGPHCRWLPQGASWSIHTAFVMRLYLGFLQYCYRSTQQCTAAEIALARCAGQLGDGMSLGRWWKKASSPKMSSLCENLRDGSWRFDMLSYFFNMELWQIYGTPPPPKPTFCHFLTVFTVFCNLFGTLNFEANFEGGPYIYICIHFYIFLYVCVPVCVCVSDLMCSDKVLRRY